ncbi:ssb2 [Candida margitis]|uniref:ssb2 n=1 Tax=Candida margitis TaxID=1775924 RepID=UPI002226953A|nr:ssb2 [Candida margitis]KAI5950522.1 ssb2 [Candida margitis]
MSDFGNYGNFGGDYGGGGFSNSGLSQGGFSGDANSQQNKVQTRNSIAPVTIKQILEAEQPVPDGEFKVHNVSISLVGFIGVVRKVHATGMTLFVTVEDGTGSIDVRKWIDENNSSLEQEKEKYMEYLNKYVFVGGALKVYNNNKNIQNASISVIEDSNQIIYHHLNAIYNHLKSQGITKSDGSAANGANDNKLFVDNEGSATDRVLNFIRQESKTMPEGVPITYITQKLSISEKEGEKHCNDLVESGKIYVGFNDGGYIAV